MVISNKNHWYQLTPMKKYSIFIEVRDSSDITVGVLIKKFKLSNFAAIMILVAADLGIGYFTLPYVFNMDNIWGTIMLIVNCGGGLFSCYLFIQTCEITKLK